MSAPLLVGRKLEETARDIYGDIWVSALAKNLRRSKRTILRYRDGDSRIPGAVRRALLALIDAQITILMQRKAELSDEYVADR